MEPNDQNANNQRAEQPNNAPNVNNNVRAEQPNNAPNQNRRPSLQVEDAADDASDVFEEAISGAEFGGELRALSNEVRLLKLKRERRELLAQNANLEMEELRSQFIKLVAAKCAYKKIDRNLMPYIAAQMHMLGAEKQLTDLQIAEMLEDEQFMKAIVSKITKYYSINNYDDAQCALAHNRLMDATVIYRPWWWLWGSKELTYERTPGFVTAPSLRAPSISRNTPPAFLQTIGWVSLGLGAAYGIYHLCSRLMTTSITHLAPSQPLPPTPIGTAPPSSPNMTPLVLKAFTNISASSWSTLFRIPDTNIVIPSLTQVKGNTTMITPQLLRTDPPGLGIISPLLPRLKKLEPTSIRPPDSFRHVMSRLTSITESILSALKQWLQNKANTVIDSARATMIRSPETLPSVPEDLNTQLRSTILCLMHTSLSKCWSLLTSSTRLVTRELVSCIACLKEQLITTLERLMASDGGSGGPECQEMWIHLSAIP